MYYAPGIEWKNEEDYTITDEQKAMEWCTMVLNRLGLARLYTRQAVKAAKKVKRDMERR